MPYDNWQFWVVTLAMLGGVYMMIRPFLGTPSGGDGNGSGGSCSNCAMGASATRKARGTKTKLTVEGRKALR